MVRTFRLRGERRTLTVAATAPEPPGHPPRGQRHDQQTDRDHQPDRVPALAPAPRGRPVSPPPLRPAGLLRQPPRHHPSPRRRLLGRPLRPGFGLSQEALPLLVRYRIPALAHDASSLPYARSLPRAGHRPCIITQPEFGTEACRLAGRRPRGTA